MANEFKVKNGIKFQDNTVQTTAGPSTTGTGASGTWGISISGSSASTTGNAATVTNGVYLIGNQSIAGIKTFTNNTASTSTTTGSVVISGGIGISGNVNVGGALNAISKSFLIDHPTKPGKKLQYGSLEGPEYGVYVRGKLTETNIIELPDYWVGLVDPNSITINLTPIGKHQNLFVKSINTSHIVVASTDLFNKQVNCFYVVYAERKDINKLQVEI